jgi:hypothetical protein
MLMPLCLDPDALSFIPGRGGMPDSGFQSQSQWLCLDLDDLLSQTFFTLNFDNIA